MTSKKTTGGNRLNVGWQYGKMLIRIQEEFSASIFRKLSVEAFTVSSIIWLALERMLSHASKYQKMLRR
jgi:hypothetical protein